MKVKDLREQESVVEAVLFTMGQSVEVRQLAAALECTEKEECGGFRRRQSSSLSGHSHTWHKKRDSWFIWASCLFL